MLVVQSAQTDRQVYWLVSQPRLVGRYAGWSVNWSGIGRQVCWLVSKHG